MKILLYTEACFTDSTFPLYKAMREKGMDATCLISLSSLHTGMIDISQRIDKQAIIPASQYAELRFFENYMDISHVYVVNHQLGRRYPWRFFTSILSVWNFIRKGHYDVVQTDILFRGVRKLLYCYSEKMVFVCHDPLEHTGMEFSKSLKKDLALAYKKIPKTVILNAFQFDDFCKINRLNPKNVLVNKLGPLDCIKLYSNTSVPIKEDNIIFFGRIVRYKGLEYLCQAMLKVREAIPSATLTIAGSGQIYFDMEPYKDKPYIQLINRFIGNEELAQLISQSEIAIYPYTDATQSGSLLTCYALNKPVVATDIETMRDAVDEGRSGLLVAPKDPDKLAEAIIKLLRDKETLRMMKEYIQTEYVYGSRSWGQIVEKYSDFYLKDIERK